MAEPLVLDASAMVDLLVGSSLSEEVRGRLRGHDLQAPGHFDAEVLSAIGRIHRAGGLSARQAATRLDRLAEAPVERHPLPDLVRDAWRRRHNLRLVDALYAELAERLDAPLITTDHGLAAAYPNAELLSDA